MDWCLYGDDKRKEMDRDLKPEYLLDDLAPEAKLRLYAETGQYTQARQFNFIKRMEIKLKQSGTQENNLVHSKIFCPILEVHHIKTKHLKKLLNIYYKYLYMYAMPLLSRFLFLCRTVLHLHIYIHNHHLN